MCVRLLDVLQISTKKNNKIKKNKILKSKRLETKKLKNQSGNLCIISDQIAMNRVLQRRMETSSKAVCSENTVLKHNAK